MGYGVIDHIETVDSEEVNGVVHSLTRLYRVTGLANTDYTVLWSALSNVNPAPGIPKFGDTLPAVGATSPFSALVLTRRATKLVDHDKGTVDVTLKYEHILQGPNQNLARPANLAGLIYTKGKCSVREKATNFYHPYGLKDGTIIPNPTPDGTVSLGTAPSVKTRIVVGHQYIDDPELGRQYKEQLGEIKVPFPESNAQFEGYLTVINPVAYAQNLIACINSKVFMGQAERTWLCSEISWQVLRPDKNLYRFGFEFQNNPDTWDPDVVFLDSRTNLPPSQVVLAVNTEAATGVLSMQFSPVTGLPIPAGAWTVPYLRRIDFAAELGGAFFEGGNVLIN